MEWNTLKELYRGVLENQLTSEPEENTIALYNQLIQNGYEHDQIIDKLTPYMHDQITEMGEEGENVEPWKDRIAPLMNDSLVDCEYISKGQAERIIKNSRKEFGTVSAATEKSYMQGIQSFEYNLLILCNLYGLNSRQISQIVKIWIIILYSQYHEEKYNLSDTFDNDFIEMAHALVMNCNIYQSEELMEQFKTQYPDLDPETEEVKFSTYAMNFKCLNRILDRYDLWTKKYGSNGYVQYITKTYAKLNAGE